MRPLFLLRGPHEAVHSSKRFLFNFIFVPIVVAKTGGLFYAELFVLFKCCNANAYAIIAGLQVTRVFTLSRNRVRLSVAMMMTFRMLLATQWTYFALVLLRRKRDSLKFSLSTNDVML